MYELRRVLMSYESGRDRLWIWTPRSCWRAVGLAREKNLISIGLAGKSGGKLRDLVDHCICIPSDQTP